VDADQVLAFRLARSGLAARDAGSLAEAAACPASDFARDSALLALAARREGVTRESYVRAADGGELILAHIVRGAIHALAPAGFALYGRALLARNDDELATQLGEQVRRLVAEKGFAASDALDEVSDATRAALSGGARLSKNELHEQLRGRVSKDLMPWCKSCGSHHVAPMLWRFAGVKAGARLDSERRYLQGKPGRSPAAAEAIGRFLGFYGPAGPGDFADWSGVAKPHARRLWERAEDGLAEVPLEKGSGWITAADRAELDSPPSAQGVRLIPPGDPYLQKPNRALLAPTAELRKRMFGPVASPGAVLKDGRLVALWRVKAKGRRAEISVDKLGRISRKDLSEEAERVADLRGAAEPLLVIES
jgi:Winged helix DNA-binding domain